MSEENSAGDGTRYAAFLCYSTRPDYGLARKVHRFLSGFHAEAALRPLGVSARKFCMDGVTFRYPRQSEKVEAAVSGEDQPSESIRKVIRPYLVASDSLVILWPGSDLATVSMIWELEEFLRQNQEHHLQRPVWLAVTRGENPEAAGFFSEALVSNGLADDIYFDFRGHDPKPAAAWSKVRDFNEEQVRLACELLDIHDKDQRLLSADDVLPAWKEERLGRLRRTVAYAITVAIAMTVATAVAIYQANAAEKERKNAEAARISAQQEEAKAKAARDAEIEQRKIADQNRMRAEKLQRNAEGVIRRMQGEIRDTPILLKRIDLMSPFNEAVSAYLEESASDMQGRLSMTAIRHQQQGDTYIALGELASAREQFEKALELARQAKWDSNSSWQGHVYGGLHLTLGQLLDGDPAQAEKRRQHLLEAQAIAEKQLALEDPPVDANTLWAGATAELATLLPADEWETKFGEIISRLLKTVGELPAGATSLREALLMATGTTRHRLVSSLEAQGLTDRALSAAEDNLAMLEGAETYKSKWRMEYARFLSVVGDLHSKQNIWGKAYAQFEQSAAVTEKLAKDEPPNLPALELNLHCLKNLEHLAGELQVGETKMDDIVARKAATERQIKYLRPSHGVPF